MFFNKIFKKKPKTTFCEKIRVDESILKNCPISLGLIRWVIKQVEELNKVFGEDIISNEIYSDEDKILIATQILLHHLFIKMVGAGDFQDPSNDDHLIEISVAFAIGNIMNAEIFCEVVNEEVVKNENLNDKLHKTMAFVVKTGLPLYNDDKFVKVFQSGATFYSKIIESEDTNVKEAVGQIRKFIVTYILSFSEPETINISKEKLEDYLVDSLYKPLCESVNFK